MNLKVVVFKAVETNRWVFSIEDKRTHECFYHGNKFPKSEVKELNKWLIGETDPEQAIKKLQEEYFKKYEKKDKEWLNPKEERWILDYFDKAIYATIRWEEIKIKNKKRKFRITPIFFKKDNKYWFKGFQTYWFWDCYKTQFVWDFLVEFEDQESKLKYSHFSLKENVYKYVSIKYYTKMWWLFFLPKLFFKNLIALIFNDEEDFSKMKEKFVNQFRTFYDLENNFLSKYQLEKIYHMKKAELFDEKDKFYSFWNYEWEKIEEISYTEKEREMIYKINLSNFIQFWIDNFFEEEIILEKFKEDLFLERMKIFFDAINISQKLPYTSFWKNKAFYESYVDWIQIIKFAELPSYFYFLIIVFYLKYETLNQNTIKLFQHYINEITIDENIFDWNRFDLNKFYLLLPLIHSKFITANWFWDLKTYFEEERWFEWPLYVLHNLSCIKDEKILQAFFQKDFLQNKEKSLFPYYVNKKIRRFEDVVKETKIFIKNNWWEDDKNLIKKLFLLAINGKFYYDFLEKDFKEKYWIYSQQDLEEYLFDLDDVFLI